MLGKNKIFIILFMFLSLIGYISYAEDGGVDDIEMANPQDRARALRVFCDSDSTIYHNFVRRGIDRISVSGYCCRYAGKNKANAFRVCRENPSCKFPGIKYNIQAVNEKEEKEMMKDGNRCIFRGPGVLYAIRQ